MLPREREAYAREVAEYFAGLVRVDTEALFSPSRNQRYVVPRHLAWYCLRRDGWTLEEIGEAFGRDHSTIHHGVALIGRRIRIDMTAREMVEGLMVSDDVLAKRAEARRQAVAEALERAHAVMALAEASERVGGALVAAARAVRDMAKRLEVQAEFADHGPVEPVLTRVS